ncbi:MAG: prepilin-type N-terminal cleavage/methylation domain-containing protein [Steroidobacteraceae bacterium]
MSHRTRQAAGFTLIELVVVIVISAIVAVFMVLFLDTPIESYFAQTRRSDLVDSAHRISDAVMVDARTALPNSMRVNAAATALELLATTGVARYYGTGDNPSPGEELTIGSSIPSFGTIDPFSTQPLPYSAKYVSVGNLGTWAYNSATGVMTPAGDSIKVIVNPGTPPSQGENQVTFSPVMTFQNAPPSAHNAYLVSGPVSYVCNPNPANPTAGTLMRYSGYAVTPAQAVPPAGTGALIAHDVSACTISIVPAPAGYPYGQLAILRVTLSNSGETLQVFLQAPTEYNQ